MNDKKIINFQIVLGIIQLIALIVILYVLTEQYYPSLFEKRSNKQEKTLPPVSLEIYDGDMIWGSPEAPVTLYFFYDYQCEHCIRQDSVMEILKEDTSINKFFRIVYKNYPLAKKSTANYAAKAVYCLKEQADPLELNRYIIQNIDRLSEVMIDSMPVNLGLDIDTANYRYCLTEAEEPDEYILKIVKEAGKNALKGTPMIFINQQRFLGIKETETLKKAILSEVQNITNEKCEACN